MKTKLIEPTVSNRDIRILVDRTPLHEDERRMERRRRSFKGAKIVFNNGYGAMECTVRNRSSSGAKLAFGDTTAVPNVFRIQINGEETPRKGKICWRNPLEVGVRFCCDENAAR